MSQLIKRAFDRVLELSEEQQDRAAQALLTFAESESRGVYRLSADERAAIAESKAQFARGEFATEEEVEVAFAHFGK